MLSERGRKDGMRTDRRYERFANLYGCLSVSNVWERMKIFGGIMRRERIFL